MITELLRCRGSTIGKRRSCGFSKGVSYFAAMRRNIRLNVTFATNISAPLDRPKFFRQHEYTTTESFNIKKLHRRLISEEISLMRENCKVAFFRPPFGGLSDSLRPLSRLKL